MRLAHRLRSARFNGVGSCGVPRQMRSARPAYACALRYLHLCAEVQQQASTPTRMDGDRERVACSVTG